MNKPTLGIVLIGLMLVGLGGCNVAGYVADVVAGDESEVAVTAEYAGLQNKSVAVVVNADAGILYRFPQAQLEISAAVGRELAGNVPGITVIEPRDVVAYQMRNIYWASSTYSQLAAALKVDRLVFIELQEYRLNEPGNTFLYRGVISGRVDVAEADGPRPNDAAYSTLIAAAYPPNNPHGVPDADPLTIRKGVLDRFARKVGWKFYDHQELRSEMGQ